VTSEPPAPQEGDGTGVGGSLIGPDGVDLSHYDMGWDDGAWNNFYRHFWGNLTQMAWTIHRWIVQIGVWFLTWTFKFGFAKMLLQPVTNIFNVWQHKIIEPLGLPAFFFFVTCVWFGWLLVRGRAAMAVAELATSLVISALSTLILANPGKLLLSDDGLLGKTRDISFGISAMTFGHPEVANQTHPDPAAVIGPMRDAYVQAFVVEPHMILDWGRSLDAPGADPKCLTVYKRDIADGPWGNKDTPRNRMNVAGCKAEFKFNHDPSAERFVGTGMVGLAGLVMTLLTMLICGVVCIAQAMFAAAVVRCSYALAFGLLPSGARGPLWSTLESVLKAVASTVASILFLAVFLVTVRAMLQNNSQSLMARLVGMDLLAVFGFVFRSRINRAGHRAATRMTQALAKSRHTGMSTGGGWLKPAAAGAGAGFAAADLWRENQREIHRALAPARTMAARGNRFAGAVGLRNQTRAASSARHAARAASAAAAAAGTAGAAGAAAGTATGGRRGDAAAARLGGRLAQSRAGRLASGTVSLGKGAGKVAWGGTIGAPVTVTRGAAKARSAAGNTSAAVRTRLSSAADATRDRVDSVRGYGNEWGRSVATVTGVRAASRRVSHTANTAADLRDYTAAYPEQLRQRLAERAAAAADAQRARARAAARPAAQAKSRTSSSSPSSSS
jgi:hypothetical protein